MGAEPPLRGAGVYDRVVFEPAGVSQLAELSVLLRGRL